MEYVILAIIVIVIIWAVVVYNSIFNHYNASERAWADVIAQERQRGRIIPELEKVLKQHTAYESNVQEQITKLRQGLSELNDNVIDSKKYSEVNTTQKELMKSLHIAVENYPELQASQSFAKYMQEITNQEENVGAALRIFNRNVANFNSLIQGFPGNIINTKFNKKEVIETFTDTEASASFEYKPKF